MRNGNIQLTILIGGRVQGVFFRRGVKLQADELGLVGRARNLDDGSVEIIAEGKREALQKLLDWCYRGSGFSRVESLKFAWAPAAGIFEDFEIIRRGNYLEDKLSALKNLGESVFSPSAMPRHVALIPDGNRRWARSRGLAVWRGHEKGISNFTGVLDEALRMKIPYLTAWGFSTENWKRDRTEVNFLMRIFSRYLDRLEKNLIERETRFRHFGRKDRLPESVIKRILRIEAATSKFLRANFGLALDYGGRDEIMRAISKCKKQNEKLTEEEFSRHLDTNGFPDPDLIIRTSGEQRTSGLMPWQGTYAELYFAPVHFPDFDILEFRKAIAEYGRRKRNFGS